MAKRLLCVVLSLLMIMAVLPAGVVAEDSSELPTSGTVSAGKYTLTDDVTLGSSELTIASGTEVTIDLNGHTIYATYAGNFLTGSIVVNGTLNIMDSKSTGSITNSSASASTSANMICIKTGGVLNVSGGTIENKKFKVAVYVSGGTLNVTGGTISNTKASSYAVNVNDSSTVTINGGEITTSGSGSFAIYESNASSTTITINNGTISNTYSGNSAGNSGVAIYGRVATWVINGGTFTSSSGCTIAMANPKMTINGGTFSTDSGYVIFIHGNGTSLVINNGTFTSGSDADVFGCASGTVGLSYSSEVTVYGGTFSSDAESVLEQCLAEGCETKTDEDGNYVVTTASIPVTTYTLTYDDNVYSEEITVPEAQTGTELTISSTAPTRSGYTFSGWNTASDGSGTAYAVGDSITISADTTLYAVWTKTLDKTWVSAYNVYNGNSLGIGFYIPSSVMTVPTQYTVEITITYGGSTGTITAGQSYTEKYTYGSSEYWSAPDSDGDYFIEFHNIMAYQMTDEISVDIYDSSHNKVCDTYTTCIREYEMYYINRYESSSNEYQLAFSILSYGATSQTSAGYNTGNLADSELPYTLSMLLSLVGE